MLINQHLTFLMIALRNWQCECRARVLHIAKHFIQYTQNTLFKPGSPSLLSQSLQAPRKHKEAENGTVDAESKSKDCNGTPLLSECALQEVRDDLQLHLCLSSLFMLPAFLSSPSLIYWIRNLRCWCVIVGQSWKQTYHNYCISFKITLQNLTLIMYFIHGITVILLEGFCQKTAVYIPS